VDQSPITIPGNMLVIEISTVAVSCSTIFCLLKDIDYRGMVSCLCEALSCDPTNGSDLARDAFASCTVPQRREIVGHTHPVAASARNAATTCARNVAITAGCGIYFQQMSKANQRIGLRGSRQTYWAKDTNVANRLESKKPDDFVCIVDTDYYMDMPYQLGGTARPHLLYTAVPAAAATVAEDTHTCFDEEGRLVTTVAGGGKYRHHLWDYGADSIMVTKSTFGIMYRLTTYAVERKQVTDHRQLVLLAPIKVYLGPVAWLAWCLVSGTRLKRFDPMVIVKDGTQFVRFNVQTREGPLVTTARPNSALCATIKMSEDDAIATVARMGTTNLMLPTTASWLGADQASNPSGDRARRPAAAILTEYHRLAAPSVQPTVFPVEIAVRAYQFEPRQHDQDARTRVSGYMPPFVHAAFAPVINAASERQAVAGRITAARPAEPKHCNFVQQCMEEFIEIVCGDEELTPCLHETVAERQTSAQQVQSVRRGMTMGEYVKYILKCFIKGEAYAKLSDPRIISTFNDRDKLEYGTFMLVLGNYMKRFKWYGPGLTPLDASLRVAELALNAEFLNISDFKHMDGTITFVLRLVDSGISLRLFKAHRAVLNELLKHNVNNRAILPQGTSYQQEAQQASGGFDTSSAQTIRAAFAAFLGYRNFGLGPYDAFGKLGIHTGDDGLDPDLPAVNHQWACGKLGLKLEADIVYRGEPGVNFLARYYSTSVWHGSPDSMCDFKRQISKFHTTLRLPPGVSPEQKLVEKAMAYVATDGNTPVIGEYCKRVLELSSYRPRTPLGIGHWWSRFEESVQYPNANADGWMDVELKRNFPEFDRGIFNNWLASAGTIEALLAPAVCAEPVRAPPGNAPATCDGDIIEAKAPAQVPPPVQTHTTHAVARAAAGRGRGRGVQRGEPQTRGRIRGTRGGAVYRPVQRNSVN